MNMPRWEKDAKTLIRTCLLSGSKPWGALLKETGLSGAQISRTIKELIEKKEVSTSIDDSKRPVTTIYSLDKKKALSRMTESAQQLQKKREVPSFIPFPGLGKFAQKQPGKLKDVIRLEAMRVLTEGAPITVSLPSNDDIDMETFSLEKEQTTLTAKEVSDLCTLKLVKAIVRSTKSFYGIEVSEELVEQETKKLLDEGFFDLGPKSDYGVRVKKKLAEYCKSDGQDLNEIEVMDLSSLKQIQMGISWIDDFFRLISEANQLEKTR
jgi:hypothetical protein